jgi:hypothetical protein
MGEIVINFSRPIIKFLEMPKIDRRHIKMEIISDSFNFKENKVNIRRLEELYSRSKAS